MTLPNRPGYKVERRGFIEGNNTHNNGNNVSSGTTSHLAHPLHHGIHPMYEVGPLIQERHNPPVSSTALALIPSETNSQDMYGHQQMYNMGRVLHSQDTSSIPPTIPNIIRSTTPTPSSLKTKPPTDLTPQAIQEKKAYIQNHRLHPYMLQIINDFKREGIIPAIPQTPAIAVADHSLNEFLESQGIESPDDGEEIDKLDEFSQKLQQFKAAFNEEINKLKDICNQYTLKMVNLLKEQSQIRHVSQEEIQAKTQVIQNKFDYVKNQLRTNVCNAILVLQKQYNHQSKKKKRCLSKKATLMLNEWFFNHINDPYPSEEEKSALATQCVLSLNQVNNWFGNKRIRYKRKCLEGEQRRTEGNLIPNMDMGMPPQPSH